MRNLTGQSSSCFLGPKTQPYWRETAAENHKITGMDLVYSFVTLYLGKISETVPHKDKYLSKILLASSRKVMTRKWWQVDPLTLAQWLKIINETYCMERLLCEGLRWKNVKNTGGPCNL